MDDRRKHPRLRVDFRVELFHPECGAVTCKTMDMSDGGMRVAPYSDPHQYLLPPNGSVVSVKIEGILNGLPELDMKIVRSGNGERGLCFL